MILPIHTFAPGGRFAAFLAICAALGCSGPARVAVPAGPRGSDATAQERLARLPTADSLWSAFRVEARLAFSTPQGRGTFSAELHVRGRDSVYVHLRAPLGIEPARVLLTRDSVFVHDRIARVLYVGDHSSGLLPAGLHADDLAAAFFGFDPPTDGTWTVASDSGLVRLERSDLNETILIDESVNRITLRDRRDASGTVVESSRYTDFGRFSSIVLPRRIVNMRPGEAARASFVVRDVVPESRDGAAPFEFAADLARIHVR